MNRLYKNSLLYLVANIAVKAATFLLVPFYSYLITPSEYGYIYIVVSFVSFMSLFVTCSLHGAITRFYWECKDINEIQKMFSTITYIVLFLSFVVATTMLFFSELISNWLNLPIIYLKIAIFSSVFTCFYELITALLYMRQEAKKISFTSIGVGFVQISIQLILILNMKDKAMAMISSQLICAMFLFVIFVIYSKPYLRLKFDCGRALTYVKYSICQVPSDVSTWLLHFSDRMIMNKMKGSSITGIYGMGQTLGSIPKIVFFSINKAYVPFVYSSYKAIDNGNLGKSQELKHHTSYVFTLVTIIVTFVIIFSNNVIELLDDRYRNASLIMVVMLFAMLIDCYRTIFMNPLTYNVKYIKVSSVLWSLAAAINIGLNYILIPIYSIYGACFSMIFSYVLTFLLILYFAKKARKVEYDTRLMLRVFVVSLLASTTLFLGGSWIVFPFKLVAAFFYIWILSRLCRIDIQKVVRPFLNFINK